MDKDTQIFNEYSTLREEMKTGDSQNFQIITALVGASTLILTTAFNQHDLVARFWVFMSVFVITVPAYRLLQVNRRRTWRISTYLRVFLEPELEHTNWESRLEATRSSARKPKEIMAFSSLITNNEWFIIMLIDSLATASAGYSLFNSGHRFVLRVSVCVVLMLWLSLVCYRTSLQEKALRRGGSIEKGFEQLWAALRAQEGRLVQPEGSSLLPDTASSRLPSED